MQFKRDIVKVGKETTRGTLAGSLPLHQSFLGQSLRPSSAPGLAPITSSATYPYTTQQVALGVTHGLTFEPDLNHNAIRTWILAATKRTNGDLPALSIEQSHVGPPSGTNPGMQYLGCVTRQLTLSASRGANPSGESLLSGTIEFDVMAGQVASQGSAGTQSTGRYFQLRHGSFTLNSVAALEVLSVQQTVTIEHALGALDGSGKRLYLEDGMEENEVQLTARFASIAWRDLVLNQTEAPAVIVYATGTANETVTATMGSAKFAARELADQDGVVTEQITIRPYHTGTNPPVVWTFGAAIGADALSL